MGAKIALGGRILQNSKAGATAQKNELIEALSRMRAVIEFDRECARLAREFMRSTASTWPPETTSLCQVRASHGIALRAGR